MGRVFFLFVFLWLLSVGGFVSLRDVPKGSPLWPLRDAAWMLFLAATSVLVLFVVLLLTGVVTLNNSPFTGR